MDKNNTGCPEIKTRPRKVCQPIQHGKWILLDKGLNTSYLARTANRLRKFYPHGCVHHTPANKVAYKNNKLYVGVIITNILHLGRLDTKPYRQSECNLVMQCFMSKNIT